MHCVGRDEFAAVESNSAHEGSAGGLVDVHEHFSDGGVVLPDGSQLGGRFFDFVEDVEGAGRLAVNFPAAIEALLVWEVLADCLGTIVLGMLEGIPHGVSVI